MPRPSEIFPITGLVRRVQQLALETFEISEQDALDYAAEQVALAEGWGSPEVAANLDWSDRVRKDLGESRKLKWRSEEERKSFEKTRKQWYAAVDVLTRKRR